MKGSLDTPLTRHAGIEVPLIGGAMYPCSNPELVAAVSHAGGIGIVQPVSLTYVHGWGFREGLRFIRTLTPKPIGMNALIEQSSRYYRRRMESWIETSLEEGVRFFITSLGNPRWVVDRVSPVGGVVYHDVTERKWALKGLDGGVQGLIAVNRRAGGHAGPKGPEELLGELGDLGVPLVCAGGIGNAAGFVEALRLGYAGAQLGTRFIATVECRASEAYKRAILEAEEDDIVLTERITGVPVAVIRTPLIDRLGLRAGPIARWMLKQRRTKHLMRTIYALRSLWQFKRSLMDDDKEYWQAGKSVRDIREILPAGEIVRRFAAAVGGSRSAVGGSPANR
jgi:nitronate monooxygenase